MRERQISATPTGSGVKFMIGRRQILGLFLYPLLLVSFYLLSVMLFSPPAAAVQTVPYKVNFQGYLRTSADEPLADGQYNVTFRLYDALENGTAIWTEVRQETSRIAVTDGYFSVQLGDVSPLAPSLFDGDALYLEVELPTPDTATCSTNACASYLEGPMSPRQPIASSPYAFNADQLDGYDAAEFAIGAGNNMFTGMNTFKTDNSAAFAIQNANGDSLLAANTSTMQVTVGTATNGVALSVNGIALTGTARGLKKVTLIPEYAGATFQGDGTNNNGSLSSDFCSSMGNDPQPNLALCSASGEAHNYYRWTSDEATFQDYNIFVRYRLPSDYDAQSMTNLQFAGHLTNEDAHMIFTMYDESNAICTHIQNLSYEYEWIVETTANPVASCSTQAGQYITFMITPAARNGQSALAGEISFDYRSTF